MEDIMLTFKSEPLGVLAQLCLDNKLYNEVGLLKQIYKHAIIYDKKYKRPSYIIIVCFDNEIPVGVILNSFNITNFFVVKEYRRKGIATELYKQLLTKIKPNKKITVQQDSIEAIKFFDSISKLHSKFQNLLD